MKQTLCAIAGIAALAAAMPCWAAPQAPQVEQLSPHPAEAAGFTLLAACTNVIYFPVRFAVTVVTAAVGGWAGLMTGGDPRSSHAVWEVTEGQAFVTPAVLEGREPLRFGPWPRTAW